MPRIKQEPVVTEKVLNVVDVSAIMHVYYRNKRLPEFSWEVDGVQVPTKALFGLFQMFKKVIPGKMVFCADRHTIRKEMDENYKTGRIKTGDDYYQQVNIAEKMLLGCGYNYLAVEGYEADDLIASVVQKYGCVYDKVFVWSNDRDMASLVSGKVMYKSVVTRFPDITKDNYEDVLRVPYNTLILYKALVGDSSDKVKGINGYGSAMFSRLIDKIKNQIPLDEVRGKESMIIDAFIPDAMKEEAMSSLMLVKPMIVDVEITDNEDREMLKQGVLKYGMKSVVGCI